MFLKVLVGVAAVVMCVVADGVGYDGGHVHYAPIPYDFGYGVADQYTGTDFGHTEHSDGNVVKGRYYVRLPDGRKQIVTYTADHHNGYQAQVSYEGHALHHVAAPVYG
ncbi:adult-specific cuticular protein ACP-20-like [Homarus americanus]|uniref:adult-specific cuticular protein ACP-20-like n=1 Tax=Homarus americanus TaxID=6706 RepID=UPI001C47974F|nr:adult-specific cuticular protein ACP-20-like [Homarus americanus]